MHMRRTTLGRTGLLDYWDSDGVGLGLLIAHPHNRRVCNRRARCSVAIRGHRCGLAIHWHHEADDAVQVLHASADAVRGHYLVLTIERL